MQVAKQEVRRLFCDSNLGADNEGIILGMGGGDRFGIN